MTTESGEFLQVTGCSESAPAYPGCMSGFESEASRKAREPETVTVNLERKALFVANAAAQAKGVSLSEWLSRVAWEQAIAEAAETSAEQYRLHPDEPPGWEEEALDRIFGLDAA